MVYSNNNRKYWPKPSDNTIIRYLESYEIEKQSYYIIESIVALANSDGGRIFIGYKKRYSTPKEPIRGGIPEESKHIYKSGIDSIVEKMSKYVDDFTSDLIQTEWIRHEFSTYYYVIRVKEYDKSLLTLNWPDKKMNSVFVRENGKNVKYAPYFQNTPVSRKRIKYKILQPAYSDGGNYFFINNPKPLEYAYKYMTIEAFILSLHNGTWQFVEPTKWNDEYEGRFYHANYDEINKPADCPPKLFATCITGEIASEASWKVYSHGQGLGSKCVQIKINMQKLRKKLSNQILKKTDKGEEIVVGKIYEGLVYYDLSDVEINTIHITSGAYYQTFFDAFDREKFLKLLLIKRKAYEYEKETRLFIVPNAFFPIKIRTHKGKGETIQVKMDWKDIIEEIRIDKKCSDGEKTSIKYALDKAGIAYREVKKIDKTKTNEIPLLLFNVDEMEGKKGIKISKSKKP